jgi:hypothetical protein
MPTTNSTNTSNQYNPASMNAYNAFTGATMGNLMSMASNPLGSSYFQNQLAQQKGQSQQVGQRNQSNLLQNMRTGGGILSNSGGFMNAQLQRNNIANSGMQSNAFNSAMNSALQNRTAAQMSMAAYQPLQTGQNSTSSTGGLGTWLPQVAGAALSMAAPGLGSMMGGGSFSAGYSPSGGGSMARSSGSMAPQLGNLSMGPAPAMMNPYNMPGFGDQSMPTYQ